MDGWDYVVSNYIRRRSHVGLLVYISTPKVVRCDRAAEKESIDNLHPLHARDQHILRHLGHIHLCHCFPRSPYSGGSTGDDKNSDSGSLQLGGRWIPGVWTLICLFFCITNHNLLAMAVPDALQRHLCDPAEGYQGHSVCNGPPAIQYDIHSPILSYIPLTVYQ